MIVMYGKAIVHMSGKKQKSIALSSKEAENVALLELCKVIQWPRVVLKEVHVIKR